MKNDCVAGLSGVSKKFGKTVALNGLDLEVKRGELLAVLGPNGAGKSTAISILLGLRSPDQGSAQMFGESPRRVEARRQVGVMMQEVALAPELRVREQIDLAASYYPEPLTVDAVLEMTQTAPLRDRPYGKLSAGQKRQAQFAVAVCGRPKLMFLDEPTVGLDIQARETMWGVLRRLVAEGASIVLTTHYLEEAEALADRVAVLARGRMIASGTVSDIRGHIVQKHISCSTTLAVQEVASWPGVESVTCSQLKMHITANNAEDVVRRLLAADEALEGLEVRRAGLSEAFTELTQPELKQEVTQ
jgi:ABC-type multidrug transport system ATPase subunit